MNSSTLVTPFNSLSLADSITAAVKAGDKIKVNGHTPVSAWGTPAARAWGNGTVSYRVKAKAPGKYRDVFVKAGSTLTITAA